MEMTLVMKSKNVCLLYLPVISRGIPQGNKDRLHLNVPKKKGGGEMFKSGEIEHENLFLDDEKQFL